MDQLTLTVLFEPVDDGWVQARIAELPEVITAGRDRGEARQLVLDALREYLAANAAAAASGPDVDREELTILLRASA